MSETACFGCGADMKTIEMPIGTVFTAAGNFGSGVFDPLPMSWHREPIESLLIVICDDCMKGAETGRILHQEVRRPEPVESDVTVKPWTVTR